MQIYKVGGAVRDRLLGRDVSDIDWVVVGATAEAMQARGPDNPIRVETDPASGEPAPSVHVRRGLEARIARPVFYELVEMAEVADGPAGPALSVRSGGVTFALGPPGAGAP